MKKKIISVIIMILLTHSFLFAHPHLFIKPSIDVAVDNNTVKGFKITWKWDKWWSADVIADCDLDRNGLLNNEETRLVYKDYFIGVRDYDFFMGIIIDGKKIKIVDIKDFSVIINSDKTVSYTFFIPLEYKFSSEIKLSISFNDKTVYTSFDKNVSVTLSNSYTSKNLLVSEYDYYGVKIDFVLIKNK